MPGAMAAASTESSMRRSSFPPFWASLSLYNGRAGYTSRSRQLPRRKKGHFAKSGSRFIDKMPVVNRMAD
jgi:hypothetical protein